MGKTYVVRLGALAALVLMFLVFGPVHARAAGTSYCITDASVTEGDSGTKTLQFHVTATNNTGFTTVNYDTSDGTATTADNDYESLSGRADFPTGDGTQFVRVTINGDTKYETDETFTVTLSSPLPSNGILACPTATGTITNDDPVPTVSIANVSQNEGNTGTSAFNFGISLSNPSYQNITGSYSTANGTATTADNDYTAVTGGSFSIPSGQTSTSVAVTVKGDTKVEADETFAVNLSGIANAANATASATGTILDDDAPTIVVSPTTLTNAQVGAAYNKTISASGGTSGYSFSVPPGTLPSGLSLSTGGVLSGTPTAGGSFPFTVTATDSSGSPGPFSGTQSYTLVVDPPSIAISPTTLTSAKVGVFSTQTVSASGGTAPYSFTKSAGTLPAGMTLTSAGVLSGTPTAGGAFTFTVTATDSSTGTDPYSTTRDYSLTVNPPTIVVSPSSLPAGTVGAAYTATTITASGGTASYTFAVTVGSLPAGMTLSGSGGLSGTPTAGGSFPITVRATDSSTGTGPYSATRDYTLTINPPTIVVNAVSLPTGTVGSAYTSTTITASGGTTPHTFAVSAGALPAGISLSPSGTLSGTPTAGGSFDFTVRATDASTGTGPYSGTRDFTVTINAPTIAVSPASLPNGAVAAAYNQAVSASGGTASYAFTVSSGALPPGLSLNGGAITGTPTGGGPFSFQIQATDSSTGTGPYSGTRDYTVTIDPPTIAVSPQSLPGAVVGTAYNQAVSAGGGTAPYGFQITVGALPAGLSLASDGTVSGTPTAGGSFGFTVQATDASTGTGPFTGSQSYTLTVDAPTIAVAPATLPDGTVGVAYNQSVSASGGTAPYGYTISAGALPAGMNLSSDGTLAGTPTAGGSFSFTIQATDASTGTGPFKGSGPYTLTVAAPAISVTPSSLPNAMVGAAYSQGIAANSGTGPYTFSISAGALPAGLSLAGDGTLAGKPTAGGVFSFTVQATDTSTGTGPYHGSQGYTLTVDAPTIAMTPGTLSSAQVGATYHQVIGVSGGTAPYAFSITKGTLPAGLSLDGGTGILSGTPTAGGPFSFTIQARDSSTGTGPFVGSVAASLNVAAATTTTTAQDTTVTFSATSQSVTFTAAVTAALSVNEGNLTFTVLKGATVIGTPITVAVANGHETGTYTLPAGAALGDYTIQAKYAVGTNFAASQATGTLTVNAASLALSPGSLAAGTAGVPYHGAITAAGGSGSGYTFSTASGSLPAGITLAADGTLSGTPAAAGSVTVTVSAQDSAGNTGSKVYTLTIGPAQLRSIQLTCGSSGTLRVGEAVHCTATGAYTDNSTKDMTSSVTYTSSAPSIVTVDAQGNLMAQSPGTATITARVGDVTQSFSVTVPAGSSVGIAPAPGTRPGGAAGGQPASPAAPTPAPAPTGRGVPATGAGAASAVPSVAPIPSGR